MSVLSKLARIGSIQYQRQTGLTAMVGLRTYPKWEQLTCTLLNFLRICIKQPILSACTGSTHESWHSFVLPGVRSELNLPAPDRSLLPGGRDASVGDVLDVLHACSLQERGGECAPDTAGAGDGHRPNDVPDLFRYPLAQPLIGNVYRPLDVPHFPLFWAANV